MSKFTITQGKGFYLEFENGYKISTQIGFGNYCDNHSNWELCRKMETSAYNIEVKSDNCEIAIFDKYDKWVTREVIEKSGIDINNDGDVAGYVEFKDWFNLLKFIETL